MAASKKIRNYEHLLDVIDRFQKGEKKMKKIIKKINLFTLNDIIILIILMLLILCTTSCDQLANLFNNTGPIIQNNVCSAPLSDYCDPCKTFEEYKAQYITSTTVQNAGTLECQTTSGKLLSVLWTEFGNESRSPVFYFDRLSGKLISMHKFSDCNEFCNYSSFDIWYGLPLETDCDVLSHITDSTVAKPDMWELEVTTTSSSQNMTIQMDGSPVNPVNLRVDWGDGIEETTILTSLTHTYASAGVYTMRIGGEATRIYFDNPDAQARLTRILSVVKGISGLTSFENTFHNCTNLTGKIPAGLFDNCPNVTTFKWVFRDCSGLTGSIPAGLFDKCPDALNFRSAFIRCSGLTGPIPAGLFDKNPNASDFLNTFQSCSGLTAIPDGLFNNNPNASNFMYTFQHCTGLTYVPSNLFDNTPNVTTFQQTFAQCTGITSSVPELWVDTATKFPKLELPKFAGGCFSNVHNASNFSEIPSMWGGSAANSDNTGDNGDSGVLPGEVLNLNQTYSISIQAGDEGGYDDGIHYFFTAGYGNHTLTLTNLTTDVDVEIYEWDGTQTLQEIIYDYDDSPFFVGQSFEYNLDPEMISTSSLVSGKQYLIYLTEWNITDGTCDLLINNP